MNMTISEQIALVAIFYVGQVFAFCRLTNKNVLEWCLLIMCKEHTLSRSANLNRNHPTLCFLIKKRRSADTENLVTSFWTVTFSTYGSVYLEFFGAGISETILNNKRSNRPILVNIKLVFLFLLAAGNNSLVDSFPYKYAMLMITKLIELCIGKLILNHLVGNDCREFGNGLLDSHFFKLTLQVIFWNFVSEQSLSKLS